MKLLKKKQPPTPEHGDWRLPLEKPEEAEHLPPRPLGVWKLMQLRVEYLQSLPVGADAEEDETAAIVPIAGWARFLRLVIAWCLLLPLSVVMVYALLTSLYQAGPTMGKLDFWLSEPVWYSILGVGTFSALIVARFATPILVYIYVLGHELTHAIAAKMCLGKVQSLRIDLDGGYVETDADNLFIALSPYFVPFWMCCWMLILWGINLIYPFPQWESWFYAGSGFWWSFHLYWTVWVIPREQPDMLENGLMFSLLLIMVLNIAILLAALCCFGVITPAGYGHHFLIAADRIGDSLQALWAFLRSLSHS